MDDKVKNVLVGTSALAAFALGGAAVAGAADGDSVGSGSSGATTTDARSSDERPRRDDEELLSGETASRVREAALARVTGGTIERVETDADGHAAYEAHMLNADGERVTVYVDEQFDVVDVESGR